jgi:D-lactate dehydrogenase
MIDPSLLEALRAQLPLAGLSPEALSALAEIAARRALASGDFLFREGDPAEFFFVVEAGALRVEKRSEDGVETAMREMGPGEIGGLTSMYVDKTRSATLIAEGATTVITFPRAAFHAALAEHPALSRALLAHLGQKVRAKTAQVATLLARAGRDPREVVAFFDTKPYDKAAFEARMPDDLRARYFESRLGPSTVALARGYPVVCAFVNDELSAAVLEELARFGTRLLALRCAGYNNVDLAAAARLGIEVARVPAYSPHAVAEHAMALVLTLNRKIHRSYNRVREGNFSLHGLVGFDLFGRTAGLVGLGKIGRCLAAILRGFGMTVLAHDLHPDLAFAASAGVRFVGLDELFAASDIVSLHAPLSPATHHLVGAERLAQMKPGAMLINTSRGGLVDTAALVEALKTGHLGAAGLDVYEEESEYFFQDRSDHAIADDVLARLMTFPNVIVTSHQAFLTADALDNIAETTLHNLRAFLGGARGPDLPNRVAAA